MIESKPNLAVNSRPQQLVLEAKEKLTDRNADFSHQIVRNLNQGNKLARQISQQRKLLRHRSATFIEPRLNMPISPDNSSKIVKTSSKMLESVIRGSSKIQYIPFEKKVIQYKDQQKITRIPKKRYVTEYREEKTIQTVPREVIKQDYYAVQHLRKFVPQEVEAKEKVLVPREFVRKKIQYVPVQRQIIRQPPEPQFPSCQPSFYQQIQNGESELVFENFPGHLEMNRRGTMNSFLRKKHLSGSRETLTSRKSPHSKKLGFSNMNHTDLYQSYISDAHA